MMMYELPWPPGGPSFGPQFPPAGKGTYKGKTPWQPPPVTTTAYLDRQLKEVDAENFSGAALVPYRKIGDKLELLLTSEKPWNVLTSSYDELCWHTMGGKRIIRSERLVDTTAIRCFLEAVGEGVEIESAEELFKLTSDAFVMWYPKGKFALMFLEVKDGLFSELPEKFATAKKAKEGTPQEEFTINKDGVKKWTKQLEAIEWVSAGDLVPETKKDCSDLVRNVLQVQGIREFLEGTLDPSKAFPQGDASKRKAEFGLTGGKAGTNGKGKAGEKGDYSSKGDKGMKGKGKKASGKDKSGMAKSYGKGGFGMFPSKGMPPMMPAEPLAGDPSMQLQLYGEQLFVLIQPLVPNQYVAQKITGMLLELPPNELLMNLTNHEELARRVGEALALLKEDGVV